MSIKFDPKITSVIQENKYAVVSGESYEIPESLQGSFDEFKGFYNRLKPFEGSEFFNKYRPFGIYRNSEEAEFLVSQDSVTPFLGGYPEDRGSLFSDKSLYDNEFLKNLIKTTVKILPDYTPLEDRYINVIMTRHFTSVKFLMPHHDNPDSRGDGVEWVVQYNINRSSQGIEGGEIRITSEDYRVIEQRLLAKPLDSYFVEDKHFKHGATAINIAEGSNAVRDIVVIRPRKRTATPLS